MSPQVVALDHKKEEMKALLIAAVVAVIYAAIRAKHDSFLSEGKWKIYAFLEGIFVGICVVLSLHWIFVIPWWNTVLLTPVFGIIFWIFFDGFSGILRDGNFLYIGRTGFDQKIRNIISDRLYQYLIFKLVWLVLTTAFYIYI